MKYCPNPSCPTLLELGIVAEYEDRVERCVDCGTLLISADSPPQIAPQRPPAVPAAPAEPPPEPPPLKVCPNPNCPTLLELGFVEEYEGDVDHCQVCGTQLVPADSAPAAPVRPSGTRVQTHEFGEEAVLLGSFESWEDVEVLLDECERRGIPVATEEATVAPETESGTPDAAVSTPLINLLVRRQDLFRGMVMLNELFGEPGDEDDDNGDSNR